MDLWTGQMCFRPVNHFGSGINFHFSSSDRAVDIYSKMLSKQKKGDRGPRMEQIEMKRQEEQAEMERLRQIRQQEQNELQIKAEVERRVQNEVSNLTKGSFTIMLRRSYSSYTRVLSVNRHVFE